MSSTTARKTFALANDIVNISPQDEIYVFNAEANKRLNYEAPWKKELSQAASHKS
jgi:COP9 signalosome complex subunit 5